MKRPSFQFYPEDWLSNSNLRRCSHEEKGIWMDVLCLLHDQEEYGVIRWPLKEIAQSVNCTLAKINGLVTKGVLKGSEKVCEEFVFIPRHSRKDGAPIILIEKQNGPIWYSSRMVVDEYKRQVRDGSNQAPNHSPKGGLGATPKHTPNLSPIHAGVRVRGRPSPSPSPSPVNTTQPKETDLVDFTTGEILQAGGES